MEKLMLAEAKRDNKAIRALVDKYSQHGWTFKDLKNGHVFCKHESGATATIPGSPSDHRSMKNAEASLKRPLRSQTYRDHFAAQKKGGEDQ